MGRSGEGSSLPAACARRFLHRGPGAEARVRSPTDCFWLLEEVLAIEPEPGRTRLDLHI